MAIISKADQSPAKVDAQAPELSASVNLSAALMDMLAGTYSFGLMAAIREAIQNGCDASRRQGLSFEQGVFIELPTAENLVFSCTDKGAGMTHEFMTSHYLAFGSSTKNSDDGSAGGLGIGRWAAYGYIREACITTTNNLELVERTYFQYQGEDGTPKVRLASEAPGTAGGTQMSFPVKLNDLSEVYAAVDWLKGVMALTMGDSFSVDKPHLLPGAFPRLCAKPLELGQVNPELEGVLLYPMSDSKLHYASKGTLSEGSLLVMTNKEDGIGGLPFHVRTSKLHSVFSYGMVIEVPMKFRVPFMPSREEVKYTDTLELLMNKIETAALQASCLKAKEILEKPFSHQTELFDYFSTGTPISVWAHNSEMPQGKALREILGSWRNDLVIPTLSVDTDLIRFVPKAHAPFKRVVGTSGVVRYYEDNGTVSAKVTPKEVLTLFVNDCVGGLARIRAAVNSKSLVFTGKAEVALAAAKKFQTDAGGLPLILASTLPPMAKLAKVGGVSVRSTKTRAVFWSLAQGKLDSDFFDFSVTGSEQLWLQRDGGQLKGFEDGFQLKHLTTYSSCLRKVMRYLATDRIWLLNEAQANELKAARESFEGAGYWGLSVEELCEQGVEPEIIGQFEALKLWLNFNEGLLAWCQAKPFFKGLADGSKVPVHYRNSSLIHLMTALGRKPRMELVGTKLDVALRPMFDVLTGEVVQHSTLSEDEFKEFRSFLDIFPKLTEDSTSTAFQSLLALHDSVKDAKAVDNSVDVEALCAQFPLLMAIEGVSVSRLDSRFETATDDLVKALAYLY